MKTSNQSFIHSLVFSLAFLTWSCQSSPQKPRIHQGDDLSVMALQKKLKPLGIRILTEREARIPKEERGKYLPLRAIPGHKPMSLEPCQSGYLLTSIQGVEKSDIETFIRVLTAWRSGEQLTLKVRRNPHLQIASEWWERELVLKLP